MARARPALVAPDGGWAWMVCVGSSLITLCLRGPDSSFGLLFRDFLKELGIESTGASFIMSVMDATANFSGLAVGVLIKKFSYRKVAIMGSITSCTGLILTSGARSMTYIICTYSLLGGLGTGLATAAAYVAMNNFFDKKRGQAIGFSMAGTSLAMMLMPQLVNILLTVYNFSGTVLNLGGLALHSIIGGCLLQPIAWHMVPSQKLQIASVEVGELTEGKKLLQEEEKKEVKVSENAKPIEKVTIMKRIKGTFDLDLLQDFSFLNILFGLGLFYVSEMNFKLMTPFFLYSIGMNRSEAAYFMSLTAFTDIIARIIVPTIFDRMKFLKRHVFWICSIFLAICRSVIAEQTSRTTLLVLMCINGFVRGCTLVNINLTVSEHCSLEKLPSAIGIFMVTKGLFVITFGPLIGFIRDYSGSYVLAIHTMSGIIALCCLTWGVEFFLQFWHSKRTEKSRAGQGPSANYEL